MQRSSDPDPELQDEEPPLEIAKKPIYQSDIPLEEPEQKRRPTSQEALIDDPIERSNVGARCSTAFGASRELPEEEKGVHRAAHSKRRNVVSARVHVDQKLRETIHSITARE